MIVCNRTCKHVLSFWRCDVRLSWTHGTRHKNSTKKIASFFVLIVLVQRFGYCFVDPNKCDCKC